VGGTTGNDNEKEMARMSDPDGSYAGDRTELRVSVPDTFALRGAANRARAGAARAADARLLAAEAERLDGILEVTEHAFVDLLRCGRRDDAACLRALLTWTLATRLGQPRTAAPPVSWEHGVAADYDEYEWGFYPVAPDEEEGTACDS
jgi:hypothetical protein